ncbi:MAG: DEAD/DEAH box helicase [Candidatus Nezhaarchaeota archaeon]|nr:DEAD/DEAH box helicase [Candidatus Nezhaarchaeota archaeon]
MPSNRVDSSKLLSSLGYDFYSYVEAAVKPDVVEETFNDVIPQLSSGFPISGKKIYKHQLEALEALRSGFNVILRSGTGSGKTEAWLLYSLKYKVPTLAIYPTLALANDQIRRIRGYASALKLDVEVIDAATRDLLVKEKGRSKLRSILTGCDIVVTNPAFLLHEVRRVALKGGSLLDGFLLKLGLLVLDEVDFYGPREVALLLALIEIMTMMFKSKFQVAVLTAAIENPDELASFLDRVTGRETKIIEGKPFRVENRVYVVLGRNLKTVWEHLRAKRGDFERAGVGGDVIEALDSFELFKERIYNVIEAARAIGLHAPSLDFDPTDLLRSYIDDHGVTLVFTKSIAKAEEIARKLRAELPIAHRDCVAAHHHLASKDYRVMVEEAARQGIVKILISPRTLSQGIDIGTVVRIVHLGLPESLREFYQREGRKGRREELSFSETIILPSGKWDRDILSRGLSALKSWLQMPIEKVIINPDNKYLLLFKALLKFASPRLKDRLSGEEYQFLESLGMVRRGELTSRGEEALRNMNFYEYGPPYGVNRVMVEDGEVKYLESISHCDLVEKFQIGCIDYTSDGIVVEHRVGGKTGRMVTAVVEEKLREAALWRREALALALEEYEEAKVRWGEEPSILSDYVHGRLHSEIMCVVYPPKRGFGKYIKVPNRVLWRVVSSRSKLKTIDSRTITFRDYKVIEVPTATYGKYSDYTYGAYFELDPAEDLTLMRIGLALLMIVLRKKLRVPLETLMYSLGAIGEKKLMVIHEPESAGLIEKLDWLELKRLIEEYEPDPLDEVIMESFDEYAYSDFISLGLNWDLAKHYAVKAVEYMLLEHRIPIEFKGLQLAIPKPSRALKLASIDAVYLKLMDKADTGILSLAVYDGEDVRALTVYRDFGLMHPDPQAELILSSLVNQDFTILTYGFSQLLSSLSSGGFKTHVLILKSLTLEGKVVDVKECTTKSLGLSLAPLEEVERSLNIHRSVTLADVMSELENSRRRIVSEPPGSWINFTKYLREKVEVYLSESVKSMYLVYLVLKEYERRVRATK